MAYTRHGYQIEGTPVVDPPPSEAAKCGGPGVCVPCSRDAAQAQRGAGTRRAALVVLDEEVIAKLLKFPPGWYVDGISTDFMTSSIVLRVSSPDAPIAPPGRVPYTMEYTVDSTDDGKFQVRFPEFPPS